MSCNTILNGISDDCKNIYGGIVKIGIISKEFLDSATIANGELTDVNFSQDVAEYYFKEGHATAETTSEINFENSSTVFNNQINISLKGQNLLKRNELLLLAKGQNEFIVFYKLDTGVHFVIGLTDGEDGEKIGARLTELSGTIGARRADENAFDITIAVEQDKELPLVVDETVFDSLF